MRPADHPDFFRFAPPPGASRESTIRLDADGHFWHDGARVDHAALEAALHGWIARHPDDGRYILTNGYDWTYFQVDAEPYVVQSVLLEPGQVVLRLSDGSDEPLDPATLTLGEDEALRARVKGGTFAARFSRHAQISLAPALVEKDGEAIRLRIGNRLWPINAAR